MADAVRRFLVVSYGLGQPNPQWYSYQWDAESDLKSRLEVERLPKKKRINRLDIAPSLRTRIHDGFEWQCAFVYDFAKVPLKHADRGRRSAGVKFYAMDRGNSVASAN